MINVNLSCNKGYKWFHKNDISIKGYAFTQENQLLKNEEFVNFFTNISSFSHFQETVKSLNGIFSIVIKKEQELWATIDHVRTFPLFYYHKEDFFAITDNPESLKEYDIPLSLNEDNAILLAYSGFVNGDKTLLKDVSQLIAGESVCFVENELKKEFHTLYLTDEISSKTYEELKNDLKEILNNVGSRMVKTLENRPVAIPLSSGFDSRSIAYLLKKNNYQNLFCFTYGKSNGKELKNAQRTAEKLGYKWLFINYEKYYETPFIDSPIFKEYVNFSANYSNKFYMQEFFSISDLINNQHISKDTVFIPGHTGAIAGGNLKSIMSNKNFKVENYILENDFSLVYPKKKERKIIRKAITPVYNAGNKNIPRFLVFDNWNLQNRQAKLMINSSKVWDFFGYQYLHPLCDKELYSFFMHIPFEYKLHKKLLKETLAELFSAYGIFYPGEEQFPSEKLLKKVAFRKKLKEKFPILKRFINPWKGDSSGSRGFAKEFLGNLEKGKTKRKILSINGIYSAWYLQEIRKRLNHLTNSDTN